MPGLIPLLSPSGSQRLSFGTAVSGREADTSWYILQLNIGGESGDGEEEED